MSEAVASVRGIFPWDLRHRGERGSALPSVDEKCGAGRATGLMTREGLSTALLPSRSSAKLDAQFPQGLRIAQRDIRVIRIRAYIFRDLPRTGAFATFGAGEHDRDAPDVVEAEGVGRALAVAHIEPGGDAEFRKIETLHRITQSGIRDVDDGRGLKAGADTLCGALDLKRSGHDAAHPAHLGPARGQSLVAP